jgi:hypothetical protein
MENFNNKTETSWNIIQNESGKVHSLVQVPTHLCTVKKLKDSRNLAFAFDNLVKTITEKLNVQHILFYSIIFCSEKINFLKTSSA